MPCCIPTPTTDNNTSTGMIWVTLNMGRSAANRQGNDMELSGNFTLSGEWSLNYIITFVELIRIDGISGAFIHMSKMLCVNKWQTKFCLCNVGYIIQLIVSAIQSQVHNKWFISRNCLRIIPVFTRYFCNFLRLLQMLLQQLLQFFVSSGSCVNTALVCWSCGNAAERLAELSVRLQSCLWGCRVVCEIAETVVIAMWWHASLPTADVVTARILRPGPRPQVARPRPSSTWSEQKLRYTVCLVIYAWLCTSADTATHVIGWLVT